MRELDVRHGLRLCPVVVQVDRPTLRPAPGKVLCDPRGLRRLAARYPRWRSAGAGGGRGGAGVGSDGELRSSQRVARRAGLRDTRAYSTEATVRRYCDMNRKSLVLAVLAAALVSACTPAGHGGSASRSTSTGPPARLIQSHPCTGIAGFVCSTLTVPLDHSGHAPGTLGLQVAAADKVKASRGVLLFLTGGPGQPGVPFVHRIASRIAPVLEGYPLVLVDQPGYRPCGALNCPAPPTPPRHPSIPVPPPP